MGVLYDMLMKYLYDMDLGWDGSIMARVGEHV
jgi:hypothetical protein